MSNQAVKGLGAGSGDGQWVGDFQLTDTDGQHSLFKVKQDGSGAQLNSLYPKGVTATLSAGGTLPAGKYFYAVTALNINGETIRGTGQEVSATSNGTSNQTITITWLAVPGASSYNVYRAGTSAGYGASSLLANVLAGTLTYANSDTTALTTGTPPTATTAAIFATASFPANQLGRAYSDFTPATSGTSAQAYTLATFNLPAGVVSVNGQGLKIRAWGSSAANTNAKTMALKFGATTVATCNGTTSGANWYLEAEVYRTAAATQVSIGNSEYNATWAQTQATPAETLANSIVAAMVATNGSASADITCVGFIVELVG